MQKTRATKAQAESENWDCVTVSPSSQTRATKAQAELENQGEQTEI